VCIAAVETVDLCGGRGRGGIVVPAATRRRRVHVHPNYAVGVRSSELKKGCLTPSTTFPVARGPRRSFLIIGGIGYYRSVESCDALLFRRPDWPGTQEYIREGQRRKYFGVENGTPQSACILSGPLYRLTSDTVDWSMRIDRGQNCSSDFQLNKILSSSPGNVAIESVKLISSPQSGQIKINDTGFLYVAKADFQGRDTFTLAVHARLMGFTDLHAVAAAQSPKNPRLLPQAFPQIRRLNVSLLMY